MSVNGNGKVKSGYIRILPIEEIFPMPENEELYRPISSDDPQIQELAESIKGRIPQRIS